jgi:ATP-dependent RNA helicase DeaD
MNNFRELAISPVIQKGVDAAGFEKPSVIQERAINSLLQGADVIGQAKTGTGKTAAYGIPLLQSIDTSVRIVQALVLSPTRELAMQITNELKRLGKFTDARIVTIYGGQSMNVQYEALHHGVHVVVGTPGRLIDHLKRGTLSLDSVKYAVIDEADMLLEMGFIDDVEYILRRVPPHRQLSLFSATMPQKIIQVSQRHMRNPEKILVDSDEPSVETLLQFYTVVDPDDKLDMLLSIFDREKPSSCIVFCRTRRGAEKLARELERHHLSVVPLHGDLSQRERDNSMRLFRSGHADILAATDVAGRGIDVPQVELVINYDVPQNPLIYFHRVGRTARAGGKGKAYTIVSQLDFGSFGEIRRLTKAPIRPMKPQDELHNFTPRSAWQPDHGRKRRFQPRYHSRGRRSR